MKKILALVLCLVMAFCLVSASAEESEIVAAELLYEGVWVQFEDGFEFYIPADWYQIAEIPQEYIEMGAFYSACTEDMAYNMTVEWHPLDEGTTLEDVHASVIENFNAAEIVEVNGLPLVTYANLENNQLIFIGMDAADPGMFCFVFSPADDPDFRVLAALIASTIRNIPV